ncbi:MAG TPA: AMP-binding protein [Solirubrobacteraceae bacterium]|nr:AMP-binding protein [Solirubrobacteraceae bacterium]
MSASQPDTDRSRAAAGAISDAGRTGDERRPGIPDERAAKVGASESYAAGHTGTPLLEETIGANLHRTIADFAEREALVDCARGVRLTYRELGAAVDELARALIGAGIRRGDRVGIWSPNRCEWTLVQYATAEIGAILVNINPAYRTSELQYALAQSGCRMLICAPEFKGSDYRGMVEEVRAQLEDLERVVVLDSADWEALLAGASGVPDAELRRRGEELRPTDPINIQYTSGTTGFPKGATLTHRNILNNGYFVGELCRYTERDRICLPVPFYHCFGMVMGNLGATTHGAAMVIPAPSFDAEATLRACSTERCTSLYGVPTMFIAMLEHPSFGDHDLRSLRTGIMAGSPCPVEVMRRVIERMHMREVAICYGMTETSPVSTQTTHDDPIDRRVGSVGRVHPHVEIKIIDPASGATVARGQPGELCTRGYSVMAGYWNDPQRTAEAIDPDGWMHTGDLATMDEQGYVNIVGRSKDMVIRGGENVYPREVEEFLYGHPLVADVQVIGVPDERYGEELMAWIVPRAGATLDAAAVREFCEGRIAHYKIPRYVKLVDSFPMTVTGKVQKYKLRERAIAELGLERAAAIRTA